ncbi:hypothetical protein ACHAWU_000738 [Discostella pseudostelligera]|uniref:GIY-YIG domain-containing protein n=1 Tax=Discostella pseudostelligera TaxID=259834 RepID=A0ABD3M627_9STRA
MAAATREVILIGGDDDSFSSSGGGADVDVVLNSRVDQQQNNCSSPTAMSSSSSSAPLVARHRQRMPQHQQQHCHPQDELVIDLQGQNDSCDEMSSTSSKSSSSSSGIPSPWKTTLNSAESPHEDRPPSIIHTTSSPVEKVDEMVALKPLNGVNPTTNRKPTKKKLLTNYNATICNEDETSVVSECAGLSTSSSTRLSKRRGDNPSRRKGWNRKRGPASTTTSKPKQLSIGNTTGDDRDDSSCSCSISSSAIKSKSTNANGDDTANKHFHCYLLRSLDPDHPLMTYIGFTTHPERRIRQHNGILKNGGARRTKRSGRPWTFVCVIHGFEDKITALQFEWAWQNVDKSVAFRDALGGDVKLAKKMKRSMGPKARLEELRILLKECLPFCLYSLTVYFPERYYHDIFSGILRKGKNGNPYKKDDDESDAFEPLMNIEICSLENMPVAREAAQFKENKKARQEAKKLVKTKTTKVANSDSEVTDWLGEEDSCWSDLLDEEGGDKVNDDRDEDASFLETITENDASIALSSDGRMESDSMSTDSHPKNNMPNNEMDDLSRDFISFSMDSSREQTPIKEWIMEGTKALSTMLSADRSSSLDDDASVAGALREPEIVRETQRINKHVNSSVHDRSIDVGLNRDVIDLCDSPL